MRRYPSGVPLFTTWLTHSIASGVGIDRGRILVWCDDCNWLERYHWHELRALNRDGEDMIEIARRVCR